MASSHTRREARDPKLIPSGDGELLLTLPALKINGRPDSMTPTTSATAITNKDIGAVLYALAI